ncbi:hypothetical protein CVV43_01620 [Candidatus Saccharibacteria bacterium HGW-Saccharibacteria-1]|nr:MAG: hypothetical protein CVV43_01620 [Candidatus Saccharibacteria bacterium HGW-Saccharibacteria-1]
MKNIKASLVCLRLEMILTSTLMAMPIMTPFYNSIGLDQGMIGLSQAVFTVILMLINIPTGWLADRFSRKTFNAIGDLGCVVALIFYSQATSFYDVIIGELIFGIAIALSQGADDGLIRAYTQKLDSSGKMLHDQSASIATWKFIAQIIALIIGGAIGAINFRLAILISALPYLAGFILSLLIKEEGERHVCTHKNPIKDILHVAKSTVGTNPVLRWRIISYAIGTEITHSIIWALTPLLILAGVPMEIVAIGWIINSASATIGAKVGGRIVHSLNSWQKLAVSTSLTLIALIIMSFNLSIITIWLYSLIGASQGFASATLKPLVQEAAPGKNQSIIISIMKSLSQLIYIPTVWIISLAGNVDIRLTMVATIAIFAPLTLITIIKLHNLEKV